MDADDSYHYLMAELFPVDLHDIPEVDSGDINHPAISHSLQRLGLFTNDEILSNTGPHPPQGPLYTPSEAVDLALQISTSGSSNWCGLQVPVRSHLNIPSLQFLLKSYPDPWPLRGATYGWPLSRDSSIHLSGVTWPNHHSCQLHMDQVDEFIQVEVGHGAIFPLGPAPFQLPPPISTIPFLCVPKPPSLTRLLDESFEQQKEEQDFVNIP